MDPRLVVSLPDLPRGADISALVLRFGGECELVWLNDKNALAVFNDPARATTAMRRLDHGTVYQGAIVVVPNIGASVASSATNAWGGGGTMKGGALAALKGNPWKKAVVQEPGWREDSWDDEEWTTGSAFWKKEDPIPASLNPWSVLHPKLPPSSSESSVVTKLEPHDGGSNLNLEGKHEGNFDVLEVYDDVVDDWEKACE
ncbi:zinc finger protein [Sesbania bispinosa]|nr:zinc finger protein [Sesbania bispinosa]